MRPDRARALSRRGTRMVIDLANDYAYSALYSGGGKGGLPQLSSGGEVDYTRAHSSAAGWSMESPEREEPSGALLAFNREAHPHPLQEVSDASAPLSVPLKRRWECPLCSDKRTYHVNVRFVP